MLRPREEILARIASTIAGWKAEVQVSHEGLSTQIATANNQLSRLLEVLYARNELAVALAAARNELETLREYAAQNQVSLPEGRQASMDAVRKDMMATFQRLAGVVGRWTVEVTGSQQGLVQQIDKANVQFDALLSVLESGIKSDPAPELSRADEERIRQLEGELAYLRQENAALLTEAKRFGERADHLRKSVEERMARAEAVRFRCSELEAETESLRHALKAREAFIQEENARTAEERAAYARQAEEARLYAETAEETKIQLESKLSVLRTAIDSAQKELSESCESASVLESSIPDHPSQDVPTSGAVEEIPIEDTPGLENTPIDHATCIAEIEANRLRAVAAEDAHASVLSELAALQSNFESTQRELTESLEKLATLESAQDSQASEAQALQESQARLSQTESELESLREQSEAHRMAAAAAEEAHALAKADGLGLLSDLERTQRELAESLEKIAALEATEESQASPPPEQPLQDQLSHAETEIARLREESEENHRRAIIADESRELIQNELAELREAMAALKSAQAQEPENVGGDEVAPTATNESEPDARAAIEAAETAAQAIRQEKLDLEQAYAEATERHSVLEKDFQSTTEQLQDLQTRYAALEDESTTLRLTLEELQSREPVLQEEKQKLQEQYELSEAAKSELEHELAKIRESIPEREDLELELRIQIESLEGSRDSLRDQLDAVKNTEKSLRSELEFSQAERESIQAHLSDARALLSDREGQETHLTGEIESVRSELQARDLALEEARAILSTRDDEAVQLRTELESLQTSHETLNAELAYLRMSLTTAQEEENRLRASLETLESKQNTLESDLAEAHSSSLAQEEEKNRLQAELDTLHDARQGLEVVLQEARASLDEHGEHASRLHNDRESLQSEKEQLESLLAETRDQLQREEQARQQLLGEHDALQNECQSLQTQRDELQATLTEQEQAGQLLTAEHASLTERALELESQIVELQTTLERVTESEQTLQSNGESLLSDKTRLEGDLSELQAALEERDRLLAERETSIAGLQNYVAELEGQTEQLRDRVQESVSAIDELRVTLDAMASTDASRLEEIENNQRAIAGLKHDLADHANVIDLLTRGRKELEEAVAAFTLREQEAQARMHAFESEVTRNTEEYRNREQQAADRERALLDTQASLETDKKKAEDRLAETLLTMDSLLNAVPADPTPAPSRVFVGTAGMGNDPATESARAEAESQCQRIIISERMHEQDGARRLGRILADAGVLTEAQMESALKEQARSGELLGAVLARMELLPEEAIAQALSCQLGLPLVVPKEEIIEADAAALFHRDVCLWHVFVPLRISTGKIVIAMANPLDETACKKAADLSRKEISPVLATPGAILAAIDDIYGVL